MPAESSVPVLVSNRALQYSDGFNPSLIPYDPPPPPQGFVHILYVYRGIHGVKALLQREARDSRGKEGQRQGWIAS